MALWLQSKLVFTYLIGLRTVYGEKKLITHTVHFSLETDFVIFVSVFKLIKRRTSKKETVFAEWTYSICFMLRVWVKFNCYSPLQSRLPCTTKKTVHAQLWESQSHRAHCALMEPNSAAAWPVLDESVSRIPAL